MGLLSVSYSKCAIALGFNFFFFSFFAGIVENYTLLFKCLVKDAD